MTCHRLDYKPGRGVRRENKGGGFIFSLALTVSETGPRPGSVMQVHCSEKLEAPKDLVPKARGGGYPQVLQCNHFITRDSLSINSHGLVCDVK